MTNPTTPVAAELKACPLCHSANVLHDRDGIEFPLSVVWCGDCGCAVADDADCKRVDETPYDRWQARPEPAPVAADVEDLRAKLRCVISHASGGSFTDPDASLNEISVRITQHVNRVWEAAQEIALSHLPNEREQIVAWLRATEGRDQWGGRRVPVEIAAAIERGEHLPTTEQKEG